jgi:hypothetical protein
MSDRVDNDRRKFLAGTLVAGIGTLVVAKESYADNISSESRCDQFFLTDNLADYLLLVGQVANDVIAGTARNNAKLLDECLVMHRELECLMACLETKLASSGQSAEAEPMRTLCTACKASIQQLKDAINNPQGQDIKSLSAALVGLSKQICERAAQLLPEGQKVELDAEATALLRKIICLMSSDEYSKFNEKVKGINYTAKTQELIKGTQDVGTSLIAAREAVMNIESCYYKGDREAQRVKAEGNINQALEGLRDIVREVRAQAEGQSQAAPCTQSSQKQEPAKQEISAKQESNILISRISYLTNDFLCYLPNAKDTNERSDVFDQMPENSKALTPTDLLMVNLLSAKTDLKEIKPHAIEGEKSCQQPSTTSSSRQPSPDGNAHAVVSSEPMPSAGLTAAVSILLGVTCGEPGSSDQSNQCKKIIQCIYSVRRTRGFTFFALEDETCKKHIRSYLGFSNRAWRTRLLKCPSREAEEGLVDGILDLAKKNG